MDAPRWSATVRGALADALTLLLPVECAGCGAEDIALCATCEAALAPAVVHGRVPGTDLALASALRFEGIPARVMRALKEEGRTSIARAGTRSPCRRRFRRARRDGLRAHADLASGVPAPRLPGSGASRPPRRPPDPALSAACAGNRGPARARCRGAAPERAGKSRGGGCARAARDRPRRRGDDRRVARRRGAGPARGGGACRRRGRPRGHAAASRHLRSRRDGWARCIGNCQVTSASRGTSVECTRRLKVRP